MDEIAKEYASLDFQGNGLQNRLRREALGLTRRDIAALLDVQESTVYRWDTGASSKRLETLLDAYEHAFDDVNAMTEDALRDLGEPIGTVDHNDVHIVVPKPDARVKSVWVFGKESRLLSGAPAGLLRVLAGRIITRLMKSTYLLFARETGDTGMLLFLQVGRSESPLHAE